jgi:DNA-directed RNA polymerase subunit K/omega
MRFAELVSRCVDTVGSHFLLCNLLSQRVKQLTDGAPPKIPAQGLTRTEIALREILQGLIKYDHLIDE